jgi:hypothetical protein
MARRVFFSFHFDRDVWRANQVRNANVISGPDVAGFFDHSEYEDAKKRGDEAIRRMILRHLDNTSVTVVLIGTLTWLRPWVRFELDESIKRRNGLLGIRIHHLQDHAGATSEEGIVPIVPTYIEFPIYTWQAGAGGFSDAIEAAGQRSDALKRQPRTLLTDLLYGR